MRPAMIDKYFADMELNKITQLFNDLTSKKRLVNGGCGTNEIIHFTQYSINHSSPS